MLARDRSLIGLDTLGKPPLGTAALVLVEGFTAEEPQVTSALR